MTGDLHTAQVSPNFHFWSGLKFFSFFTTSELAKRVGIAVTGVLYSQKYWSIEVSFSSERAGGNWIFANNESHSAAIRLKQFKRFSDECQLPSPASILRGVFNFKMVISCRNVRPKSAPKWYDCRIHELMWQICTTRHCHRPYGKSSSTSSSRFCQYTSLITLAPNPCPWIRTLPSLLRLPIWRHLTDVAR